MARVPSVLLWPLLFGLLLSPGCRRNTSAPPPVLSDVALVDAAYRPFSGKAQRLIAREIDVNIKDKWGRTALMAAASANDVPVEKLLLEREAKVDLRDNNGVTALILAASSGNIESVKLLLTHGAEVNPKDVRQSPLLAAINNTIEVAPGYPGAGKPVEFLDTVKLLLTHGADVHCRNSNGQTALMLAQKRHEPRTLALLKNAGAKF